jgi:hypothetical protein
VCLGLGLAAACGGPDPADRVAARFVDAYYVAADPAAARPFAAGLAREKLDRELAMVRGAAGGQARRERRASARQVERRQEAGRTVFIFEVTIEASGMTLHKRAQVTAAAGAEGWRVMNYADRDR